MKDIISTEKDRAKNEQDKIKSDDDDDYDDIDEKIQLAFFNALSCLVMLSHTLSNCRQSSLVWEMNHRA